MSALACQQSPCKHPCLEGYHKTCGYILHVRRSNLLLQIPGVVLFSQPARPRWHKVGGREAAELCPLAALKDYQLPVILAANKDR